MGWLMLGSGLGAAVLLGLWLWWLGRIQTRLRAQQGSSTVLDTATLSAPPRHAVLHERQIEARKRMPPPPSPPAAPAAIPVEIALLPTLTLPQLAAALSHLPGVAILGPSRQGKTTLAEALIRLLDGDLAIIDPKWRLMDPPKWSGLPAAHIVEGAGYGPITDYLAALWADYERRIARGHTEINATYEPLWVVWDEINDTVAAVKNAGNYLRRWVQMGAEHGMRLIIMPQSDRVQSLGLVGHGDARRNMAWIYVGDDARAKVKELVAAKKISYGQAGAVLANHWPALAEINGQWMIIDRSAAPELAALSIAPTRAWQSETPETNPETVSTIVSADVSSPSEPDEAMPSNDVSGFSEAEMVAVARLIMAGLVSETKALETAFGVKAGGSKRYKDARAALDRALVLVR